MRWPGYRSQRYERIYVLFIKFWMLAHTVEKFGVALGMGYNRHHLFLRQLCLPSHKFYEGWQIVEGDVIDSEIPVL